MGTANFSLPTPSMLNVSQFLDENANLCDHVAGMLAYTHTLQCMGEATEGQQWHPSRRQFGIKVSHLVDAFIMATGAELVRQTLHCVEI